jgi:hypothetical protein
VSDAPSAGLPGVVSRRDMLGSLARWSVPTVITIALAARTAAAASCPPCTKKVGGKCQACTINQILNCQCEPCLGAPYCTSGAAPARALRQGAIQAPQSGNQPPNPLLDLNRSPFASPLQTSPFGRGPYRAARPYGLPRDTVPPSRGSLYDRLRADQRRPY